MSHEHQQRVLDYYVDTDLPSILTDVYGQSMSTLLQTLCPSSIPYVERKPSLPTTGHLMQFHYDEPLSNRYSDYSFDPDEPVTGVETIELDDDFQCMSISSNPKSTSYNPNSPSYDPPEGSYQPASPTESPTLGSNDEVETSVDINAGNQDSLVSQSSSSDTVTQSSSSDIITFDKQVGLKVRRYIAPAGKRNYPYPVRKIAKDASSLKRAIRKAIRARSELRTVSVVQHIPFYHTTEARNLLASVRTRNDSKRVSEFIKKHVGDKVRKIDEIPYLNIHVSGKDISISNVEIDIPNKDRYRNDEGIPPDAAKRSIFEIDDSPRLHSYS